jgi:GNAT superfamily N-acetyltransferase
MPYPTGMEHYESTVEKPLWLARFKLMHLANQAESLPMREPVLKPFGELSKEQHAVHQLYRSFFTDSKDRKDMLLALDIVHTIAIFETDKKEFMHVVGAITFMYTKNNGILLYFEVHDDFRRSSFGTYLIHLMGLTISHRSGKDHAAIYLNANEVMNSVSMLFYTKLGFQKFVDSTQHERPVPKPVALIKRSTSVFNTFFEWKNKDGMVWLSIEDSNIFRNSGTWQISIMNPFFDVDEETGKVTICNYVFCKFP